MSTSDESTKDSKLMIMLHGLGDSLDSYIPLAKSFTINKLNFLAINAPHDYPIGHSWYDIGRNPRPTIDQSVKLIIKLLEELNEFGYPNKNIFLLGFSQGGSISLEVGNVEIPSLGGILALSPKVALDSTNISDEFKVTPVFSAHGTFDEVIPYADTKVHLDNLQSRITDFKFITYQMSHEITQQELNDIKEWLGKRI